MEDLAEIRRQKYEQHRAQQSEEEAAAAANAASDAASASSAAAASSSAAETGVPAAASSPAAALEGKPVPPCVAPAPPDGLPSVRRAHILPVGVGLEDGGRTVLDLVAPLLRERRKNKEPFMTGLYLRVPPHDFVVVKSEPDRGLLSTETDFYVEGEPLKKFEKVQFICQWDYETKAQGKDPSVLFQEYVSPYFKAISDSGEDVANVVYVGESIKIMDLDFQVAAAEPSPPEIGIIDTNTLVYIDWDMTPEFDKIHIVPFQDTLPNAYQFDVFNDYLKPYLTKNKSLKFAVNDCFTFQGVQFKVVCAEPGGPARVGRNTTIYCDGVLHPSLRNLLPPELLEQLSQLPPGLQMLLLNTEALAGGYEERLMEVQEMLSRRRGMANETIAQVEKMRWEDIPPEMRNGQSQCMVCLCGFENGDEVRRLPCGHIFHASCIDEWLRRCTDCPVCKANVDRAVRHY
mmetsp:Transcript_34731/g.81084  ORF Transcript_34731/g.81084 Transcript_34731/m.81084 type:complete len:459 (-) Transcript_34731:46-1422(-)